MVLYGTAGTSGDAPETTITSNHVPDNAFFGWHMEVYVFVGVGADGTSATVALYEYQSAGGPPPVISLELVGAAPTPHTFSNQIQHFHSRELTIDDKASFRSVLYDTAEIRIQQLVWAFGPSSQSAKTVVNAHFNSTSQLMSLVGDDLQAVSLGTSMHFLTSDQLIYLSYGDSMIPTTPYGTSFTIKLDDVA